MPAALPSQPKLPADPLQGQAWHRHSPDPRPIQSKASSDSPETLRQLVRYWRECIRDEDVQEVGISPRARTRAAIAPYASDPFVFQLGPDTNLPVRSPELEAIVRRTSIGTEELVYGYPVVRYEDAGTERLLPLFTVRLRAVSVGDELCLAPVEWPLLGVGALDKLGLRNEEVADLFGTSRSRVRVGDQRRRPHRRGNRGT